jgi:hypothetical protein
MGGPQPRLMQGDQACEQYTRQLAIAQEGWGLHVRFM